MRDGGAVMKWHPGHPPIREQLTSFFLRYECGKVGLGRYEKKLLAGHGASKFVLCDDSGLMVCEKVVGWMDVTFPSKDF
jgi:hypothetical protein